MFNFLGELLGTKKLEQWVEQADAAAADEDYAGAERAYARALEMAEETKNYHYIAITAYGCARACEAQNKNVTAEKHYTKAFRTWEDSEEWEKSAEALLELARLQRTQRRLPEAEQLYRYAAKLLLEKFPHQDARLMVTNRKLAECLFEKKSYSEAEGLLQRLIAGAEQSPPDELFIPHTLFDLGRCLVEQQKDAEAEAAFARAHEMFSASPELASNQTGVKAAANAHEYARCLVRQNKSDKAQTVYSQAIKLAEEYPGYLGEGELIDEAAKFKS